MGCKAQITPLPQPHPTQPNPTPPSLTVEICASEGEEEQEASNSDIVKEIGINNTWKTFNDQRNRKHDIAVLVL